MSDNSVRYEGIEKTYKVNNKKFKVKSQYVPLLLIMLGLVLGLLSFVLIKDSIVYGKNNKSIGYLQTGGSDYKVYLKENTYYNKAFLPSGMQYISRLINTINVNYKYEIHADEKLDLNYSYDVDAKLIITDREDKSKVLHEKPFELIKKQSKRVTDNNYVLNESVDLDYDKYNNYANSFQRDYSLNVDSKLVVTMHVNTEVIYPANGKKISVPKTLMVTIPLSEQTIDIVNNTGIINEQSLFVVDSKLVVKNKPLFVVGALIGLLAFASICIVAIMKIKKNINKSIYEKIVEKYLKEYDSIIITMVKTNIDERNYDEVRRVPNMQELIDLHNTYKEPILYFNILPGEKSYFVIPKDNILYKLTISKAWLERNLSE